MTKFSGRLSFPFPLTWWTSAPGGSGRPSARSAIKICSFTWPDFLFARGWCGAWTFTYGLCILFIYLLHTTMIIDPPLPSPLLHMNRHDDDPEVSRNQAHLLGISGFLAFQIRPLERPASNHISFDRAMVV